MIIIGRSEVVASETGSELCQICTMELFWGDYCNFVVKITKLRGKLDRSHWRPSPLPPKKKKQQQQQHQFETTSTPSRKRLNRPSELSPEQGQKCSRPPAISVHSLAAIINSNCGRSLMDQSIISGSLPSDMPRRLVTLGRVAGVRLVYCC